MNGAIPGGDGFESILKDRLLERVAGELRGLVRNSIRVVPGAAETDLPVGVSRIGGRPDLPPNTVWPTGRANFSPPTDVFRRDHPEDNYAPPSGIVSLPFVAQINLAEARPFDRDNILPKSGLLLFFYDARGFPSDTDVPHGGSSEMSDGFSYTFDYHQTDPRQAVILVSADDLSPREFPADLDPPVRYPQYSVRFSAEASLPAADTAFLGSGPNPYGVPCGVLMTGTELERYEELRYALRANRLNCQLLGYADEFAGRSECIYIAWQRAKIAPQATKWQKLSRSQQRDELQQMWLLFEVENIKKDDFPEELYGRNGHLYFYISKDDVLERRFDRVWTYVE